MKSRKLTSSATVLFAALSNSIDDLFLLSSERSLGEGQAKSNTGLTVTTAIRLKVVLSETPKTNNLRKIGLSLLSSCFFGFFGDLPYFAYRVTPDCYAKF
jgi:hypothetical protein